MYLDGELHALVRVGVTSLRPRGWTSSTWATTALPRSRTAPSGPHQPGGASTQWQQDRKRLSLSCSTACRVCISSSNTTSSARFNLGLSPSPKPPAAIPEQQPPLQTCPQASSRSLTLLRLNLRSNHFTSLPVSGVLDQLTSPSEIDLHDNPWDCTCDVVGMKLWVEQLKAGVLVDEVICKSPKKFAETDMRSIKSELCPDYSDVVVSTPAPSSIQVPARTSGDPAVRLNGTGAPAAWARAAALRRCALVGADPQPAAGFHHVRLRGCGALRARREAPEEAPERPRQHPQPRRELLQHAVQRVRRRWRRRRRRRRRGGAGVHPVRKCTQHRAPALPKVKTPAGHVCTSTSPTPGATCAKTPSTARVEGNSVEDYKDLHELKVTYSSSNHHLQQPPLPPQPQLPAPGAAAAGGEDERRKATTYGAPPIASAPSSPREDLLSPVQDADVFTGHFRTGQTLRHHPAATASRNTPNSRAAPLLTPFSPNYDLRRPHQYLHLGAGDSRLRELGALQPPSALALFCRTQPERVSELKVKLNVEPDYLEVLEKQTTFSQF